MRGTALREAFEEELRKCAGLLATLKKLRPEKPLRGTAKELLVANKRALAADASAVTSNKAHSAALAELRKDENLPAPVPGKPLKRKKKQVLSG